MSATTSPTLANLRALDAAAVEASLAVRDALQEGRGTPELNATCDAAWRALVRGCYIVGVASIRLLPIEVEGLGRASFIPQVWRGLR